jgi:hypothetical protein
MPRQTRENSNSNNSLLVRDLQLHAWTCSNQEYDQSPDLPARLICPQNHFVARHQQLSQYAESTHRVFCCCFTILPLKPSITPLFIFHCPLPTSPGLHCRILSPQRVICQCPVLMRASDCIIVPTDLALSSCKKPLPLRTINEFIFPAAINAPAPSQLFKGP